MDLLQCDRGRNEGTGEPKPRVSICHDRRRRPRVGVNMRRDSQGVCRDGQYDKRARATRRGMCAEWSRSPFLVLGTVLEHVVDQKTRIVLQRRGEEDGCVAGRSRGAGKRPRRDGGGRVWTWLWMGLRIVLKYHGGLLMRGAQRVLRASVSRNGRCQSGEICART